MTTPDAEGPQHVGPIDHPDDAWQTADLIGPSTYTMLLEVIRTAALVVIAIALVVIA